MLFRSNSDKMFQSDSELRIEFLNKTQVDDFTMVTVGCPLSVRLSVCPIDSGAQQQLC